MDASHQQLLKKHRVELVNNIKDVDSVLDHLVSDGVIEDSEEAEIKDNEGVKAQVRKLLAILKDKGGNSFRSFCSALQNSGHKRLADLLGSNDENEVVHSTHEATKKVKIEKRTNGKRRRRKSSSSTSSASVSSKEDVELNQVDVQKYFDNVIKGASNKWDNLARKLGFNENDIKGIEMLKTDQDHRCREMLERWRNRDGREASLQVLKQALIEIEERLTAENLEGLKRRKKRERKNKARQPYPEDSSDESNLMGDRSAELQEPQPSTSKRKRKKERLQQSPVKKTRAESDSEDEELHEEGSSSTLFDSSDYEAGDPDAEALSRERTVRFKMLKMSKDVFNPNTVADPDKFEEAVGLFREHVGEMLGTDESGSVNGRLSDTLSRELITDDMRAAEGEDLYIHVTLLGEEEECQDEGFSDEETDDDLAREHHHRYTESHLHRGTEYHMDTGEKVGSEQHMDPKQHIDPKQHAETGAGAGVQQQQTGLIHQAQQQEEPFYHEANVPVAKKTRKHPFFLQIKPKNVRVCKGCRRKFREPYPPANLVIQHYGNYRYWDRRKRSYAFSKGNGYFHANAACIMPMFSDFDRREVVVPPSTLENLTQAHVDYCRQYGILLALGSFEVPRR
ncbi:positive regulation of MHC class I biosynthetic process [Branchiostoma belcheri]|nr:positive regulation of MHC class I biosynthetic process [Branchiostoma belcheri]